METPKKYIIIAIASIVIVIVGQITISIGNQTREEKYTEQVPYTGERHNVSELDSWSGSGTFVVAGKVTKRTEAWPYAPCDYLVVLDNKTNHTLGVDPSLNLSVGEHYILTLQKLTTFSYYGPYIINQIPEISNVTTTKTVRDNELLILPGTAMSYGGLAAFSVFASITIGTNRKKIKTLLMTDKKVGAVLVVGITILVIGVAMYALAYQHCYVPDVEKRSASEFDAWAKNAKSGDNFTVGGTAKGVTSYQYFNTWISGFALEGASTPISSSEHITFKNGDYVVVQVHKSTYGASYDKLLNSPHAKGDADNGTILMIIGTIVSISTIVAPRVYPKMSKYLGTTTPRPMVAPQPIVAPQPSAPGPEVDWDSHVEPVSTPSPRVPLKTIPCPCGNKVPIFTAERPLKIKCDKCGKEGTLKQR